MNRRPAFFILTGFCVLSLNAEPGRIQFSADRMHGTGSKQNERTVLEGNARVMVGSLEIKGARIELSGKDFRFVHATGLVTGSDSEKGFSFSADSLRYDRELEVAVFEGNALLQDTRNDVEARAGLIQYNQRSEIAIMQVAVNLVRKNITCNSAFALYRRESSLLELSGAPVVKRSDDEFRALRITVNLETENITLDGAVRGALKDAAAPAAQPGSPTAPGENRVEQPVDAAVQADAPSGVPPETDDPGLSEGGQE